LITNQVLVLRYFSTEGTKGSDGLQDWQVKMQDVLQKYYTIERRADQFAASLQMHQ